MVYIQSHLRLVKGWLQLSGASFAGMAIDYETKTSTGGSRVSREFFLCVLRLAPVQNIMHPLFEKASGLTETIIGAAIEVHRDKGPGLIESIYESCLMKELGLARFGLRES